MSWSTRASFAFESHPIRAVRSAAGSGRRVTRRIRSSHTTVGKARLEAASSLFSLFTGPTKARLTRPRPRHSSHARFLLHPTTAPPHSHCHCYHTPQHTLPQHSSRPIRNHFSTPAVPIRGVGTGDNQDCHYASTRRSRSTLSNVGPRLLQPRRQRACAIPAYATDSSPAANTPTATTASTASSATAEHSSLPALRWPSSTLQPGPRPAPSFAASSITKGRCSPAATVSATAASIPSFQPFGSVPPSTAASLLQLQLPSREAAVSTTTRRLPTRRAPATALRRPAVQSKTALRPSRIVKLEVPSAQ